MGFSRRATGETRDLPPGTLPPRPVMRGRYLIRSLSTSAAVRIVDAALRLVPVRRPSETACQRILLANWAHIGDVLLMLPAVCALRNAFPNSRIDMIVGSWAEVAIRKSGLVDRLHVIDHWFLNRNRVGRFRRYRETRRAALREIRAARYQLGIDFYPFFPPAHPLFYRCGIPLRVGFDSGGFGPLLTRPVQWVNADRPISDYAQDLVKLIAPGAGVSKGNWRYPVVASEAARERLPPGGYVVVHPGAGSPAKEWGEGNWGALAARLREMGRHVVITGAGANEEALAERISSGDGSITNLAGKTDWEGFIATIAGADALVCPDSSAAHIGALFEIPTVAVFTGTNNAAQWGPVNRRARVLVKSVPCAPCNRAGCSAMACIRGVTVAEVLDGLDDCLKMRGEINDRGL